MKCVIVILSIGILVNISCKRVKYATTACNKRNRVEIPQKVKDYFSFKEGTYWVYQNQKTLATDSHWVCESYLGTKEIKGNSGEKCHCFSGTCYENMEMKILNPSMTECVHAGNKEPYIRFFLTLDYNEAEKYSKNYYRFLLETGRATSINEFWNDGRWRLNYMGIGIGNELKDTSNYYVKNLKYTNCILQRSNVLPIYDHYSEVIMAQNIGIVSYVNYKDTTNATWHLIRKNIIQ
jgi:hypothetical protein